MDHPASPRVIFETIMAAFPEGVSTLQGGDGLEMLALDAFQDNSTFGWRDHVTSRFVKVFDDGDIKGVPFQVLVALRTYDVVQGRRVDHEPRLGVCLRRMPRTKNDDYETFLKWEADPASFADEAAVRAFLEGCFAEMAPRILAEGLAWRTTRVIPQPKHYDAGRPFPSDVRDLRNWRGPSGAFGLREWWGGGWRFSYTNNSSILDATDPEGRSWHLTDRDISYTEALTRIFPDGQTLDRREFARLFA
jgi:hypothetical protein